MAVWKISKYFSFSSMDYVSDIFSQFQRLSYIIFENFSFSWFVCIDQFSQWKINCILDEKKVERLKNVVILTCATWDLNCYLWKYHAILKFWPGKNILCFFIKKGIVCRWMQREKNIAVIHGRDRYHYIWQMKRFECIPRQCDSNG